MFTLHMFLMKFLHTNNANQFYYKIIKSLCYMQLNIIKMHFCPIIKKMKNFNRKIGCNFCIQFFVLSFLNKKNTQFFIHLFKQLHNKKQV